MKNENKKISIKELSKKFIPTIKKIFNYLKKADFNSKLKLIGELIVLILLLCLLKLPFSVVRDLIINAFFSVEIANTLLMNMLYIVFGLPYYLLAIYLFIKIIVTRYENLEVKEDISLPNENSLPKVEEVKSETNDVMMKQEENTQLNQDNEVEKELPSLANNDISVIDQTSNNENIENKDN